MNCNKNGPTPLIPLMFEVTKRANEVMNRAMIFASFTRFITALTLFPYIIGRFRHVTFGGSMAAQGPYVYNNIETKPRAFEIS